MNEKYEFEAGEHPIVYVKTVEVADLPEEVQAEAEGLDLLYGRGGNRHKKNSP